ncbi:MAG: oligopeptide/dipeptide ABC transporter ATP-binding protein [Alphaproteobacteria bacterium]
MEAHGGPSSAGKAPLLEVRNLYRYFTTKRRFLFGPRAQVQAVDGVSFSLDDGETLGLVGESGCGKSTTGRLVLNILTPSAGEIRFEGSDFAGLGREDWRALRLDMQMIFQDPLSALDPRMTIGDQVKEALEIHGIGTAEEQAAKVDDMLDAVGLPPGIAQRYPHELSGGQQQRVVIARALILQPKLIVCDEPVSALDVSIQAQVINLLKDLQARFKVAYLFISHDLSVVRHISDRIAVMYLGQIVEMAERDELFDGPRHPYTKALISAIPIPDPRVRRERVILHGDPPSAIDPPSGCRFHTRCPFAKAVCGEKVPALKPTGEGHVVACHLVEAGEL